jgi:hypothetical protein
MGNPGMTILPPLIAHEKDGEYTDEVKKIISTLMALVKIKNILLGSQVDQIVLFYFFIRLI